MFNPKFPKCGGFCTDGATTSDHEESQRMILMFVDGGVGKSPK